jgi:hypothetical protein
MLLTIHHQTELNTRARRPGPGAAGPGRPGILAAGYAALGR